MNDLEKIVYYYSPIFAAPSTSLRTCLASFGWAQDMLCEEIFRVSLVALPR